MKKKINLNYKYSCINCKREYQNFPESNNSFKEFKISTCRNCHPFWTGESVVWEKRSGKIEKFLRKQQSKTEQK